MGRPHRHDGPWIAPNPIHRWYPFVSLRNERYPMHHQGYQETQGSRVAEGVLLLHLNQRSWVVVHLLDPRCIFSRVKEMVNQRHDPREGEWWKWFQYLLEKYLHVVNRILMYLKHIPMIEDKEWMITEMRQKCITCSEHSYLVGHRLRSLIHSFNPMIQDYGH